MANNSDVQQFQPPQQVISSPHQCKECGLLLNSAESLDVHLQYHKENLLNKWASQAATSQHEETNNNNTKNIKREFIPNNIANDSSDSMKKSPEYSRTTPETIFGHPPTPQSYQSASSPYQNHDNSAFSPNFQNYQMKQERTNSPPNSHYQNNYPNFVGEAPFFEQQYTQDFPVHKTSLQNYRYHPYQQFDRPQSNPQMASSSPAYQPTPSPSPNQCDKCGTMCENSAQLVEHVNINHPQTPYHPSQFHHFNDHQIKTEEDVQSEILDLDSHKVHQVYPEEEKRQNGEPNPHSVNALLNSWSPPQKMYHQQPQQYMNGPPVQQEKLFMHNQEFMTNNVVTTTQDSVMAPQNYRAFEPTPPVIATPQVPSNPPQSTPPTTKSANWKSNEARRPKTYNCTACNKWFTSSGHLKRHYNTTLHKNAVKSSGQPDPASMPISAHHHPARDNAPNKEDQNNSPGEEDTNSMPMPGMMANHPSMSHSNVSPPNGEAGPSPTTSLDSRGLLPTHGFNMGHMMPIEPPQPQFQMYPNGSAPHVTQVTDTNSLNTTGEFGHQEAVGQAESQPLPSFSQFNRYGLMLAYDNANVGGGGSATTPFVYYPDPCETTEPRTMLYKTEEEQLRASILAAADPAPAEEISEYDPLALAEPLSPEKAHTKREFEESTIISSNQITSTTAETPFKCDNCSRFFNGACYLTQHNKTLHEGEKPYKCSRCGKRFSSESVYAEHYSKHAREKPHKCDRLLTLGERCPKQFNHKTDLRRHMCLHTGQKPFACDTCGKGFIRKDHMLKHCDTHYRKTHGKIGK